MNEKNFVWKNYCYHIHLLRIKRRVASKQVNKNGETKSENSMRTNEKINKFKEILVISY